MSKDIGADNIINISRTTGARKENREVIGYELLMNDLKKLFRGGISCVYKPELNIKTNNLYKCKI